MLSLDTKKENDFFKHNVIFEVENSMIFTQ